MSAPLQPLRGDDDFVECFLFPSFCYNLTEEITESLLISEINKYKNEIENYTKEYMWHRDPLVFQPRTKNYMLLDKDLQSAFESEDYSLPPHIYVGLHFGEDVGDEWFLVFLMMKLTKAFDGLIIKLVDSDGEFLLIEAANFLPSWASPQTCQDRVFINNGEIHVVQRKNNSCLEMLQHIQSKPTVSKMHDSVQAAIRKRISVYPEEIKRRMHKAKAFLPERAIAILEREPNLIAAAVRSICHSDPLERRVCRAMRYFPPEQRTMVNVKLTKCLYAMISHCRYGGDPRTGWNLPPPNDPRHSAHLLGIKISCGLELLIARASRQNNQNTESDIVMTENENENNLEWAAYIKRLTSNGYFRNLLEGSQDYNQLLQSAKEYFRFNSTAASLFDSKSEARQVLDAWHNAPRQDIESWDEEQLSPADSDNWLSIDPEDLQAMLDQQWSSNDRMVDQRLPTLQEKMQEFLLHSSDVDGVQFPEQLPKSDEELNQSKTNNMDADDSRIDFNSETFDGALRGILDFVVPGDENDFDSSSEGSLGGSEEDKGGELDKYMRLLDSQLELDLHMSGLRGKVNGDTKVKPLDIEANLKESAEGEAGGAGPVGNILGGPVPRLMYLHLQSPSTVPPDLQS